MLNFHHEHRGDELTHFIRIIHPVRLESGLDRYLRSGGYQDTILLTEHNADLFALGMRNEGYTVIVLKVDR